MPFIRIELKSGRTLEQKRNLVREVTKVVCETVNAKPTGVRIILSEMQKDEYALGGVLDCDREENK